MIKLAMVGALIGVTVLAAGGEDQAAKIAEAEKALAGKELTFAADIQPIIVERCQKCHVNKSRSKFSLADLESTMAGGKSGVDVIPGDADKSRMYLLVADKDKSKKIMPPKGDRLAPMQIATIKLWINGGAK